MLATGAPQAWQALVGRETQTARLTAAVEALASGRGSVLEIAGDPGTGKTRMLGLLTELAAAAGSRVARSTALRGTAVPRQLFRDAWADVPAPGLADSDEEAVFRTVRAGLAGWAAGPGGGVVAAGAGPGTGSGTATGSGSRSGTGSGRPGPAVTGRGGAVVFDDVHLADEASVRLLARLVRTPVPGPLLLAVGHCPRCTGSALLEALDDGARTGTVVRVELDPLDEDAVAALLTTWQSPADTEPLDPAYVEQIRTAADGNPRNLRILTAARWRPEMWPDSPGEDTGALLREAAAMGVELDALTPEQTAVAGAAAILAGPFRPEDAVQISGIGLVPTLDALDELVRADILRHAAPGARFAFRHPLLGHVAHERASLPTLLAGHRRALDLLAGRGAGAGDLARHAEHLVGTDGAAAVPLLVRGATEILPDAPATAVRWLGLALQTAVGDRPGPERAALMLERCRALSAAGRFEEARALVHDVMRDDTHLTAPLRLRAAAVRVAAERQLGRYDEADSVARAALDRLPRPLDGAAGELVFEFGVLCMYRGMYGQAREAVQEVVAALKQSDPAGRTLTAEVDGDALPSTGVHSSAAGAAASAAPAAPAAAGDLAAPADPATSLVASLGLHGPLVPDERLGAAIRVLAAFGDSYLGLTADAAPALVEGARLADNLTDADAARIPELLAMLGCGEMFMEGYTAAARHLRRCLTIARNGGPQQMKLNVLLGLSFIDQQTGHLARSQRRAEEAGAVARATGAGDGVSMAGALRVGAMIWSRGRADAPEVVAAAEHALRIARPGNGWWSGSAAMQLALVRMVSGDDAGCVEALLDGGGGSELRNLQPAYRPMLLSMLSTAALRSGEEDLARQAAAWADEAAAASGLSVQRAHVTRAQAALHAAAGDHAAAARLFEQAALGFRRAGRPVQHAWTLVTGAGSMAAAHGHSAAGSWLDAAEEVARVHGALRIEEEVAEVRALLFTRAAARSAGGAGDGAMIGAGAGAGVGVAVGSGLGVGVGIGGKSGVGPGHANATAGADPAAATGSGLTAPTGAGYGLTAATGVGSGLTAVAAPGTHEPPAGPLQSDVRALLTAREQEIAALVATGRRSRAIADELFLSHRTVETHLARIYRKLNVSSRTALAHLLQGPDNPGAD